MAKHFLKILVVITVSIIVAGAKVAIADTPECIACEKAFLLQHMILSSCNVCKTKDFKRWCAIVPNHDPACPKKR